MAIKNILDKAERYKLTVWMDKRRKLITTLSRTEVATLATQELGRRVTEDNLIESARILQIKFRRSKAHPHASKWAGPIAEAMLFIGDSIQKSGFFTPEDQQLWLQHQAVLQRILQPVQAPKIATGTEG